MPEGQGLGLHHEFNRRRRALATKKRHAREAARLDEGRAIFETAELQAALAALPHPQAWRAEQGETKLQWAEWMLKHSGTAGQLRVFSVVKKLAAAFA